MMSFGQAIQNMVVLSVPSLAYMLVVRWRARLTLSELLRRLGLVAGNRQSYLIAIAVTAPAAVLAIAASSLSSQFEGSMIKPFVGATPTWSLIGSTLGYGLIATGFPEEFLFRGLIAGALFRRLTVIWEGQRDTSAHFRTSAPSHSACGAVALASGHSSALRSWTCDWMAPPPFGEYWTRCFDSCSLQLCGGALGLQLALKRTVLRNLRQKSEYGLATLESR